MKRKLILEDVDMNRDLLSQILEKTGSRFCAQTTNILFDVSKSGVDLFEDVPSPQFFCHLANPFEDL